MYGLTRGLLTRTDTVPQTWHPAVRALGPTFLPAFTSVWSYVRGGSALVFLHSRDTPSAKHRLVMVQLANDLQVGSYRVLLTARQGTGGPGSPSTSGRVYPKVRALEAVIFAPATKGCPARVVANTTLLLRLPDDGLSPPASDAAPGWVRPAPARDDFLRVFAGQPDDADPAHFTIPYQLDGTPGVIDGSLDAAGVSLRPRVGAARADRPGERDLPPATQAAR